MMIHNLSNNITTFFIKKMIITNKEKDICCYGMEVILSTIIGFGVILVLSCILGKLSFGIFYLIYIVPIRMSVGGYHAKSYFKCNIIFAIFFVLAFLLCENQTVQGFKVLAYINLVSVFFIMRYAPLENENKKLSDSKKNIYKHVNILIYTIGGMAGVYC